MTKHNKDTEKLISQDIILINNRKIIYKTNNYKNRLKILEAINIKN